MNFIQIREAILDIVFPQFCVSCENFIEGDEKNICWSCMAELDLTENYKYERNAISELFDGIVPVWKAASYYSFKKGGVLQKMIHELKYRGNVEVGTWIGERMAEDLVEWLDDFDMMLPIPIHPKKKNKRGYNQTEIIARAISEKANLDLDTQILIKTIHNESQTKKNKQERIENVKNVFEIKNPEKLQDKKILIIDDLVTTGSTTISAIQTILEKAEPKNISVVYVASQPFL